MNLRFLLLLVAITTLTFQKSSFAQPSGGIAPCVRYVGTVNGKIIVESCYAPLLGFAVNNIPRLQRAIDQGRQLYIYYREQNNLVPLRGAGDSQLYRGYQAPQRWG